MIQILANPESSATLSEDWWKCTTAAAAAIVKITNRILYLLTILLSDSDSSSIWGSNRH